MKVSIPVVTKDEIIGKKRVTEYGDRTFNFDVSLASQKRWEAKFPEIAERIELLGYIESIEKNKQISMAVIVSKLKGMYCFFDTDMSFIDFLKMFDFTNIDYTKRLTDRINEIFELVFDTASEKN